MLRLIVVVLTAAACFGAGVHASLVSSASLIHYAYSTNWFGHSDANLDYFTRLGTFWGVAGAMISIICLAGLDRKYLWRAGVIAIVATWLVTYAGVWWHTVNGLR